MNLNIFTFHSSELMEDLRQMFESSAKEKNISFFVEDSINSMWSETGIKFPRY